MTKTLNITYFIIKAKKKIINFLQRAHWYYLGNNTLLDSRLSMGYNKKNIYIGDNVRIRFGWRLEAFPSENSESQILIKIDDGVKAETFLHIGASNGVYIGKNVLIASNVYITDHNHNFENTKIPILKQGIISKGEVHIMENVWIGQNAVILPGVTIGKNSVIAANAVINCDVPDCTIYGGVPAKFIKKIEGAKN
jgi:acetyltransferase-like isoleucine patch superfamily enzyme